jgi:hypothetical protein
MEDLVVVGFWLISRVQWCECHMERMKLVAVINENPSLKTITKQKKWIENGRKPHFESKI